MHEFELIARLFRPLAEAEPGAFSLTDDAASLDVPPGLSLVITKDIITAGVHFIGDEDPSLIARKLLRVNLSDLVAKGARPWRYLLGICLPRRATDERWLRSFADGLRQDQEFYGIVLAGGDSTATPGPLTLSLTAMGLVSHGRMIRRRGAQPSHDLYLTGTLGDAALGLRALKDAAFAPAQRDVLIGRYRLPEPRVTLGPELVGIASAAMDVSDGLAQDLGHLCAASGCGATVHTDSLPLSPAARTCLEADPDLLPSLISGGDDYEILFTAPPEYREKIEELQEKRQVPITRIGLMQTGHAPTFLDRAGRTIALQHGGYRHF